MLFFVEFLIEINLTKKSKFFIRQVSSLSESLQEKEAIIRESKLKFSSSMIDQEAKMDKIQTILNKFMNCTKKTKTNTENSEVAAETKSHQNERNTIAAFTQNIKTSTLLNTTSEKRGIVAGLPSQDLQLKGGQINFSSATGSNNNHVDVSAGNINANITQLSMSKSAIDSKEASKKRDWKQWCKNLQESRT